MALTVYTTCPAIGIGCFLYQESGLITPVADGKYSLAYTDCFTVSGGLGEVTAQDACGTTTTSTTTTTTTTAAPDINGTIQNINVFGATINSVSYDGSPVLYVSGDNLPIAFGNNGTFDVDSVATTATFVVNVTGGGTPPGYVHVVDGDGVDHSQAWAGDGNYTFTSIPLGAFSWLVQVNNTA